MDFNGLFGNVVYPQLLFKKAEEESESNMMKLEEDKEEKLSISEPPEKIIKIPIDNYIITLRRKEICLFNQNESNSHLKLTMVI